MFDVVDGADGVNAVVGFVAGAMMLLLACIANLNPAIGGQYQPLRARPATNP